MKMYINRATNLDLGTFDLGVEPVVRGKGDRYEASGNDTGYGREGQRHRGTGHLGILFFSLVFLVDSLFRTPVTFTSHHYQLLRYGGQQIVVVVFPELLEHP